MIMALRANLCLSVLYKVLFLHSSESPHIEFEKHSQLTYYVSLSYLTALAQLFLGSHKMIEPRICTMPF